MNKKADVPWMLIMFAVALVVLVVVIALLVGKTGLFKSGSEQATEKIYQCYCTPPGEKTICRADDKTFLDKSSYKEKKPSLLSCSSGWEDCGETCWEEIANE